MKLESPNEMFEDILFIHQTLLGNQVAFEKLVIKYRPMIFALVASYVKNSADAEDLTQEVFLKAYQNLSSLKNHGQFSSWLKQIAKNHCTDWLRRQRENHLSFEEIKAAESAEMASPEGFRGFSTSPEEMALKQELRELLWQAIDSLLEIDRKLLEAHYLEDVSLKQLQADYGLSYCAVAGRLKRAKQQVRQQVQKLLGGFCALPGREIMEKIFLGGIEAVKLSLKTKLVTVGVVVMLGLGGVGVWHWHSKLAPQKTNVVHQQETKSKKTTSASATPKVVIEKPAPKVALQPQPAQQSAQKDGKQKEISDEERAEFLRWLDEMEQSDEQSAEEANLSQKESTSPPVPTDKQIELSLFREGITLFGQKRFGEAASIFDEFLLKFPNSPIAWNIAHKNAFCKAQLGQYDEALNKYEAYITNYPGSPYIAAAYTMMGAIYMRRGSSEKALENYRLALQHADEPKIQASIQSKIDEIIRSNMNK